MENLPLASVAYDRYTAVCKPLHYTTNMTTSVCAHLTIGFYICGFLNASINIRDTFSLSLCESHLVHHVLWFSSSHVSFLLWQTYYLVILTPTCSYFHHLEDVLSWGTSEGSTHLCFSPHYNLHLLRDSHLYVLPSQLQSFHGHRQNASVFYTMLTPMLNPGVYSLRNKEFERTSKKVFENAKSSLGFTFKAVVSTRT